MVLTFFKKHLNKNFARPKLKSSYPKSYKTHRYSNPQPYFFIILKLSLSGAIHGCRTYSSKVDYFAPGLTQVKVPVGETFDDVEQPKSFRPERSVAVGSNGKNLASSLIGIR